MKNLFWQPRISIAIFAMLLLFAATSGILVSSQQKPLTLDNIFAALNPGKTTPKTNTLSKRINLLLGWVKVRQVNFPLTPEIETQIRNVGANNELIETIRRNSPPVKVIPTPTPITVVKEIFVTPTPTPFIQRIIVTPRLTPTPQTSSLPNNITVNLPNSVKIEFVKIPAGSFMMGSPDSEKDRGLNERQHKVTIGKDFYLGKYEVTQAQWKVVMGKNNNPSHFKGDNLPVENVRWGDAKEFIGKLNSDVYEFGLPSEAEWEYACRAGTTTAFSFGDNLSSAQANFNGNYPYGNASKGKNLKKTSPVGNYGANSFGLFDMHGNV
jgi:Sulfatase-modifying factor enzyme 1